MRIRKLSARALAAWIAALPHEAALVIADDPAAATAALAELAAQRAESEHFVPLSDNEAIDLLITYGREEKKARAMVQAWRHYATTHAYTGPVAWRVKAEFLLYHANPSGE